MAPQQPRVGSPVCQGSLRPRACGAAQDTEPRLSLHAARWPPPLPSFPEAESHGGPGPLQLLPLTLSLGAAARLPRSHLLPTPASPSAPGANKDLFSSLYLRHVPRTRPCGFPLARQPRAGWLGAGLETGRPGAGSPRERQLPGLRPGHFRCSLRLGLGLPCSRRPGSVGGSEEPCGPQAGRPSETAESRLFPARRLPRAPLRDAPSPSGLCHPLQPRPLAPPLAIPPDK